jgi:hypothetical protein
MTLGADTLLGIARTQRRTLGFVSGGAVNSGAVGAYAELTYTLNGAFNVSGGASAIGFSKYMAFYSKCFVMGATIAVRGSTVSPSTHGAVVGVSISTNSTAFTNSAAAIGNGMSSWTVMWSNPDRYALNESVDVGRFLNKPKMLDDPQLFSTSAANPTQVIVAHLFIAGVVATAGAINTDAMVEILLDCVFTDPVPFT